MTKLPTKKEMNEIAELLERADDLAYRPREVQKLYGLDAAEFINKNHRQRILAIMNAIGNRFGLSFLSSGSFRSVYVSTAFPELVFKYGTRWCNEGEYTRYKSATRSDKLRFARVFAISDNKDLIVQRKIEGHLVVDVIDHFPQDFYDKIRARMNNEFAGFCDAHDENVMYVPEKDKLVLIDLGHE